MSDGSNYLGLGMIFREKQHGVEKNEIVFTEDISYVKHCNNYSVIIFH